MKSQEFRSRKIDEIRSYLLDKIKHNDLMSKKYKKTCKYLNYVEHLLFLASTVTGCISISAFTSFSLCYCWHNEFCNKNLYNHCRN